MRPLNGTRHLHPPSPATNLPPGPRLMPPLIQTLLFLTRGTSVAPRWQKRYGDVFSFKSSLAGRAVVLTRPEHIREVFGGPADVFHAGEGAAIFEPIMGRHSVFLLDEDTHLATRKRLMAALHGTATQGCGQTIEELAAAQVATWPTGKPFALLPHMSELGLEVMMRVVFGVTDNERLAQARSLLGKIAQIKPTVIVGFRYPWLNRVGPWRRFQQLMRETDLLIYTEIATRRDLPDLADRPDVLSKLLAADSSLTDSQLRDNLVTLLLAGHETTAATLAWALHDLARSPRVLARVRCAADENDEAYLEATVKEAMRRRPVIRSATRRLAKPVQVAGYVLPAGIDVLPSILLAHQSPSLYPSPDEFRPERFLGSTPPPATWIPFGGGIRRCLGAALATIQVQAVLKVVLRNVDITAVGPPESEKIRNVTTVPGRGALIISRPR